MPLPRSSTAYGITESRFIRLPGVFLRRKAPQLRTLSYQFRFGGGFAFSLSDPLLIAYTYPEIHLEECSSVSAPRSSDGPCATRPRLSSAHLPSSGSCTPPEVLARVAMARPDQTARLRRPARSKKQPLSASRRARLLQPRVPTSPAP